ncbi:hypothetical protein GDO81_014210 [Engystomops pustulosus]|uniref:Uncharacterized protein n=1 Tax=Engystomops pustulosus TaxID=76066 RepID=A0AAV7B8M3_ENGPU|nr:hypothetical protein GDO81_014210 [Engystomops pustulosus]
MPIRRFIDSKYSCFSTCNSYFYLGDQEVHYQNCFHVSPCLLKNLEGLSIYLLLNHYKTAQLAHLATNYCLA